MKKKTIFELILVLLSMLSIILFSTETASNSTKTSKTVTRGIVSVVVKDEEKVDIIVDRSWLTMRKIAHFIEYFIFGLLLINLLKDYLNTNYKLVLICIFLALLFSISDEIHQIYVMGRSGEIRDVCIDTIGSSVGIIFYYLLYVHYKKQ